MKKLPPVLVLLGVLISPAPSQAVLFNIFFDDFSNDVIPPTSFQHADWSGTYDFGDKTFSALIGDCAAPAQCTYNLWHEIDHPDPNGTAGSHGSISTR